MADLSGLSTNYFATPKEGFTTTLASTISSGATTVPLNSITGYTNGAIATMVVEPTSATAKQTFTGVVDTAGIQLTSVKWTEGTNQSHSAGSTVVDYVTATHMAALVKGLTTSIADQDGTLKSGAVDVTAVIADGVITKAKFATAEKTVFDSGWSTKYGDTTFPAPNTVTYNGNRSYDLVFNSTDLTGYISPAMKLRTTRTVTAPTQCTSLNGSTQYYSKSSPNKLTFTDDFVVSAWVKLTSHTAGIIASRTAAGASPTDGWRLYITSSGQVSLQGLSGGSSNQSSVTSYQSIPLNKWVHITAQLDMSTFTATTTTSYTMIDGVDVPASVARTGTNPTALIQSGSLEIGSNGGGTNPFPGKIAQVAIYNAKVTQANIRLTYSQGLSGSETSLASAYSFNNSIADLNTSTPNDLTANGSAVATNADSPFSINSFGTATGTTDYAIVTASTFSTNTTLTVQVPEGCTIPTTGGVSAVSYSTQKAPYGMPISKTRWVIESNFRVSLIQSSPTAATYYNISSTSGTSMGRAISAPIGEWFATIQAKMSATNTVQVAAPQMTFGTSSSAETDKDFTVRSAAPTTGSGSLDVLTTRAKNLSLAVATDFYILMMSVTASASNVNLDGSVTPTIVTLEFAYL